MDADLRDAFYGSRKKRDVCGNNSCHYAFTIGQGDFTDAYTKRYKFIQLLFDEEVGSIDLPNIKG